MKRFLGDIQRVGLGWDAGSEPLLAVTRGGAVESVHRGVVAVTDARGRLLGGVGDPDLPIHLRSAAKPFQALPLVALGAAREMAFTDEELAVVCGSHAGAERHVRVVAGLLDRLGLSVADLVCGARPPAGRAARDRLERGGGTPSSLHNGCSGKHAGMLALALFLGAPTVGYERPSHPVQREIAIAVGRVLGIEIRDLFSGTDGCGVPVLRVSARQAATLYARLAAGDDPSLARIRDTMMAQPELVAGQGFFDTRVMEAAPGTVLAKMGAEGVQGCALPPAIDPRSAKVGPRPATTGARSAAVGCCMKVEDGSSRPIPMVAGLFLRAWGASSAAAAAEERGCIATPDWWLPAEDLVPLVRESALHREQPGEGGGGAATGGGRVSWSAPTPPLPTGLRLSSSDREARDVVRFLRSEWPRADEALLGRAYEWHSEIVVIAAKDGRRPAGVLRGHLLGGVGTVQELLVAESWRGRGVGSNLLAAFEDRARGRHCHKVVLRTPVGSRAEGFYRERGYRREYILLGHHFGHDFLGVAKYLRETPSGVPGG